MLLLYTSAVLSVWSAVTYTRGFIAALANKPEEIADADADERAGADE